MAIPDRYVKLKEGEPKLLKFTDSYVMDKEIFDEVSKRTKKVKTIQLIVSHVNGKPVDMEFSVLSMKLIERLQPFIETGDILRRTFKITKHGTGFYTKYEVEVL